MSSVYRIFIVDDHPVMRSSYMLLMAREEDLELCGQAESAVVALSMLEELQPDLIIVDVSLPDMNGIELTRQLRALYPDLPVLIISGHNEALYARRAFKAGARGYLDKWQLHEQMATAIRAVLNGDIFVDDTLRKQIKLPHASK